MPIVYDDFTIPMMYSDGERYGAYLNNEPIWDEPIMAAGSSTDHKYATFVIGTATSGHTEEEVDYLCTGSNDDVVIQQAIDDLPNFGGKIVIRAGNYYLNTTTGVTLNKPVVLEGEGAGSTTLYCSCNSAGIAAAGVSTDSANCIIKNMSISVSASGTNMVTGVRIIGDKSTVRDCSIFVQNSTSALGVAVVQGKYVNVYNNTIEVEGSQATVSGVELYDSGVEHTRVVSNRISLTQGEPINARGISNYSNYTVMDNNHITVSFNSHITRVYGIQSVTYYNWITNNSIWVTGDSTTTYGVYSNTPGPIRSNYIVVNAHDNATGLVAGIAVTASSITATSNYITMNSISTMTTLLCIYVTAVNAIVSNNTLFCSSTVKSSFTAAGVRNTSTDCTVVNNYITVSAPGGCHGVHSAANATSTVLNNTISVSVNNSSSPYTEASGVRCLTTTNFYAHGNTIKIAGGTYARKASIYVANTTAGGIFNNVVSHGYTINGSTITAFPDSPTGVVALSDVPAVVAGFNRAI